MSKIAPAGAANAPAIFRPEDLPVGNYAVQRCLCAFMQHHSDEQAKGATESQARRTAQLAYRLQMPIPVGRRNIQDYIACVSHGFLLKILESDEVPRLLYTAQVAVSAGNRVRRPVGRPSRRPDPSTTSGGTCDDPAANDTLPCLPEN